MSFNRDHVFTFSYTGTGGEVATSEVTAFSLSVSIVNDPSITSVSFTTAWVALNFSIFHL